MKKVVSTVICFLIAVSCLVPALAQPRQKTQPPSGYGLPSASSFGGGYQGQMSTGLPRVDGLHLDGCAQVRRPGDAQWYDPIDEKLNAYVRWNQRCFPLKVWISDGRHLPDVSWDDLVEDRVPRVLQMLMRDPRAFAQLPQVDGWSDDFAQATADGFERWRELDKLGVVKYGFVDYPDQADVLVFYTNQFVGAQGPGGTDVHGQTYGMKFTPQQVAEKLRRGERSVPVVIELKVQPSLRKFADQPDAAPIADDTELERLRADAAHEFGHALGIIKHSTDFHDLMYVNRMVPAPSTADKAVLQWLYKRAPTYWYYSATVAH